jgi:hypothetical protein
MSVCDEWRDCTYSKKEDGRAIARLVYSNSWEGVVEVCLVSEPLVKVLRLVDSDKPAMGYLYEAMDRAKKAIRIIMWVRVPSCLVDRCCYGI